MSAFEYISYLFLVKFTAAQLVATNAVLNLANNHGIMGANPAMSNGRGVTNGPPMANQPGRNVAAPGNAMAYNGNINVINGNLANPNMMKVNLGEMGMTANRNLNPMTLANGNLAGMSVLNSNIINKNIPNLSKASMLEASLSNSMGNRELLPSNAVSALIANSNMPRLTNQNFASNGVNGMGNANVINNVASANAGNQIQGNFAQNALSANVPGNGGFGLHILADGLQVDGTVSVAGQMPVFGTVALTGNMVTDGAAAVNYNL